MLAQGATIDVIWAIRTPARAEKGLSALGDETLMCRYKSGDSDAFEELYRRHRAGLHRFLARMIGTEAEEAFQEVWIAVIRSRAGYQPQARFVTWLYTIAHHRAVTAFRRRGLDLVALEDDDAMDDAPSPFEATANDELAKALALAVDALPLPQREAFLMHAEGGLCLEEIAHACEVPRETVKSRLRYANRRLRAALGAWK